MYIKLILNYFKHTRNTRPLKYTYFSIKKLIILQHKTTRHLSFLHVFVQNFVQNFIFYKQQIGTEFGVKDKPYY